MPFSFSFLSAGWYCTLPTASTAKVGFPVFSSCLWFRVVSPYIFFIHFMTCRFDPQSGLLTGTNDGTLVNLFLRQFGRKSEKSLCILLLVFQVTELCFLDIRLFPDPSFLGPYGVCRRLILLLAIAMHMEQSPKTSSA